jgi:hypothetical protein
MIGPDDGLCPEQNDRINEDNRSGSESSDLIVRSVSVFYNSFTKVVAVQGQAASMFFVMKVRNLDFAV